MAPDHPGVASARSASVHGPIIRIPDLRRLFGRLPHCARGRVLEQDAAGAQVLADRVRSAEVLTPARLVALGDRRRDLRLAEPSAGGAARPDRKSTRLNSSHTVISYAVFCLKKKKK